MAIVLPQFPGQIWDGLSENVWRETRLDDLEPNPNDWDQIVAEMLSTQIIVAGVQTTLGSGAANTVLFTNADANGVAWKNLNVNSYNFLLNHSAANANLEIKEQWDDLRILPTAFDFAGVNDPSLVDWQPGGSGITVKAWEFAKGDEAFFMFQLPHGWKLGTNLRPHVHWTNRNRGPNENGSVVAWHVDYSVAPIWGQFPAMATVVCDGTANSATNHTHFMTPATGGEPEVNMANITSVSAMILGRISRSSTNDTWAGSISGQLPLLLEVDFHYQMDTLGSRTVGVK